MPYFKFFVEVNADTEIVSKFSHNITLLENIQHYYSSGNTWFKVSSEITIKAASRRYALNELKRQLREVGFVSENIYSTGRYYNNKTTRLKILTNNINAVVIGFVQEYAF